MEEQALSGLRVLDVSQYVSGLYCTKLLADFGAEVIKIEPPGSGDVSRRAGPFLKDRPHPERSGLFLHLNTNKKSITLNLKTKAGVKLFKELVKSMDVLVENFNPNVMPELGLGYEALQKINPSLIMTSISYFGQSGPYREFSASEIVASALGGLMHLTGLPDREPLKGWGSPAEYQAGVNAAAATMTAVYFRDETGLGQQVDVSVMETVASLLEGATLSYGYNRLLRQRAGFRHHAVYPSTILPCKDGYIHVHAAANREVFAQFLETPQQLLDPELDDALAHADEIDFIMLPWLMEREAEAIFHSAQEWRLPFAMVLQIDEVLRDPQHQAREGFVEIDHPVAGKLTYPGAPFKLSQTPWRVNHPAPLLGEHNQEVYCGQLGYSKADLVRLREGGVI